jgi:hypothetical protein
MKHCDGCFNNFWIKEDEGNERCWKIMFGKLFQLNVLFILEYRDYIPTLTADIEVQLIGYVSEWLNYSRLSR